MVETVLSVQFEPLPGLRTAQIGLLWGMYRTEFPKTEERSSLEPVIERFPDPEIQRLGFRLQAFEALPIPRLSFTSASGNEMIQVQNDRFIKNWQQGADGTRYPRYDQTIRPHFDRDFDVFIRFLGENGIGVPRINQCEVTYVNHIVAGAGWDAYGDANRIFRFWNVLDSVPPGRPEDVRAKARFIVYDHGGKAVGRLYMDVQPAIRIADSRPMYALHLMARGQVGSGLDFLDLGREWIVKTFKAVTTETMHHIWGLEE